MTFIGDLVTRYYEVKRGEREGDLDQLGQAIIDKARELGVSAELIETYNRIYGKGGTEHRRESLEISWEFWADSWVP
jgi:hypothetical protein